MYPLEPSESLRFYAAQCARPILGAHREARFHTRALTTTTTPPMTVTMMSMIAMTMRSVRERTRARERPLCRLGVGARTRRISFCVARSTSADATSFAASFALVLAPPHPVNRAHGRHPPHPFLVCVLFLQHFCPFCSCCIRYESSAGRLSGGPRSRSRRFQLAVAR